MPVILLIILIVKSRNKDSWQITATQKIASIFHWEGHITTVFVLSLSGLFGGSYFLFSALTTTDLFIKAYLIRLSPWVFWITAIFAQVLIFLIFQNAVQRNRYVKDHGKAILALIIILVAGFWMHNNLWGLKPETWDTHKMFNQDNIFDLIQQDIFIVYLEGDNLQHGKNPYDSILAYEADTQWNHQNAAYLPIFYYLSWITHEVGLEDFIQWLSLWRIVFLIANLAIAYLLFYISYHRYNSTTWAVFASLFWLFNRWTLHMTMIYHIDFIAIFFFILSLSLWPKHHRSSLLAFGISLGVKQIAIFMIPLYLIWIWKSKEDMPVNHLVKSTIMLLSIPLLVSLPFLIWNAESFIRSILISAARVSESHFGVPSFDTLIGLTGIPAKLPMLILMTTTFFL
ncbi:MAG: hypothetical protein IZT55_02875, partial [Anaerolineae bacterium]|nr:hypothetical protein [Anaerolineae bacterium]